MTKLCIGLSVFFSLLLLSVEKKAMDRFEKVVNPMVEAINKGDYEGIQRDFGKVLLDAFPLEKSKPFFEGLTTTYGKIQKLDNPRYVPPNQAIFPAHFERSIFDIKVVLDSQDKIIGLWFLPHTAEIAAPDRNETKLSLSFKGNWLVFWGGDSAEVNQHHDVPNQRFAFDFLGTDPNGNTHKGTGEANEDYFAFGRNVCAPADGNVTDVINGVRDNKPGSMNPFSALGNAVFIQHRENEVSVLAHLKLDSITVKVGDRVKKGQVIALCGNSGNSSEPHLHYHLQNTPITQDGTGIKCFFDKVSVLVGGKKELKTNYSPIKNEIVVGE
jgi:biotin carboxyl carrier protein